MRIISNSCTDSRHLWCSVRYEYAAFLIHCLYCPLTVICIHVDSFLSNTLVIQSTSRVVFNVILDFVLVCVLLMKLYCQKAYTVGDSIVYFRKDVAFSVGETFRH